MTQDNSNSNKEKLIAAFMGGFLGALIALGALWWLMDSINWFFVALAALSCGVVAWLTGYRFIELLQKILRWS